MDNLNAIEKLQTAENVYVLFSACTKLPYVAENDETADDEIFLFTAETEAFSACKEAGQAGDPIRFLKIAAADLPNFLGALYDYGINAVRVFEGGESAGVQLNELVTRTPREGITEAELPPSNPSLMICMMYIFQESRKQNPNRKFVSEREKELWKNVTEAEYIIPLRALPDPDAEEGAEDTRPESEKKYVPILLGLKEPVKPEEGDDAEPIVREWMPVFTSVNEIQKANLPKGTRLNRSHYDNIFKLMSTLKLAGCVIDPASIAVKLPYVENPQEN